MPPGSITPELQQFISRCITSVEQVETLRVFAANPNRALSVSEVFREIRSSEKSVSDCLEAFSRNDILVRDQAGSYRLEPKTAELAKAVADLVAAYRERRVTVIELIYSRPSDTIQNFADAFKLKKDK